MIIHESVTSFDIPVKNTHSSSKKMLHYLSFTFDEINTGAVFRVTNELFNY